MKKIFVFLFSFVLGFSQTNPVASDVKTAHFKDVNGLIHLVGSDTQGGALTYTVISLPTHGTLKDGSTVVTAGMNLSGDSVTFSPYSDETGELDHQYIFSGTNSFKYKITDSDDNQSNEGAVSLRVFDEYKNPPTLIGNEIDGEADGDNFGRAISMSEDGTIMAVGGRNADVDSSIRGHVRVLQYNGTDWVLLGTAIEGTFDAGKFGSSVSLSGDGKTLAVGIPEVTTNKTSDGQVKTYKYNGTDWDLVDTITPSFSSSTPKYESQNFGQRVRLSSDGKTLAVSDPWYSNDTSAGKGGTNSGRVEVYRLNEDTNKWDVLGTEFLLYGYSGNNFGWGLSLSANGNILAVGEHEYDTKTSRGDANTKTNAGQVRIYSYDSSTTSWEEKGKINGVESQERFGAALDLSSDGLTVAVGAPYHRTAGSGSEFVGKVSIFKWDNTTYSSQGESLIGADKYDFFGAQLSLDNEGNTLAIMGPGHDANPGSSTGNYLNKGRTRVYNWNGTIWEQSPSSYDFDGEANEDQSAGSNAESRGQRVFLSGDGSVLAIGADKHDNLKGTVKVYKLFETQTIPESTGKAVEFELFEQVTSFKDIVLKGTDPTGDGDGDSNLVYVITELNTAKLFEGSTEDNPITSANIPYTLTSDKVKYNSNSDVVVSDSFKFIVHDGKASSVPSTVTLTVTPDNDAPIATSDAVTTDEGISMSVTLAATDVDSPEEDLIFIIESLPSKGAIKEGETVLAAGSILTGKEIVYTTTNENYSGTDLFTFKVKDKGIESLGVTDIETSEVATISITVINTDNDPPVANAKSISIEKKTANTLTLTASDWETKTTNLTYIISKLPSQGTLSNDGTTINVGELPKSLTDNQVIYTGTEDNPSTDSFKFKVKDSGMQDGTDKKESGEVLVTINFGGTDTSPVSVSTKVKAVQNIPIDIKLEASDADGDVLKYKVLSLPSNGGTLKDGEVVLTNAELPRVLPANELTLTSNTIGDDSFTFLANACSVTNPTNTSKLVVFANAGSVTGDFSVEASKSYPMVIPSQVIKGAGNGADVFRGNVNIKLSLGAGNVFESCEVKLDIITFDDGLQFDIDGVNLLNFQQKHWDSGIGANTTEFNGSGRFVTQGGMWSPWTESAAGNPKLEISSGKIKLMLDTKDGTREDALPFMDDTVADWKLVDSFTYDCVAGFDLLIGNQNGGGGPSGIDSSLTVEAFVGPCADSNIATVSLETATPNEPPVADDQTLKVSVDTPLNITLTGSDNEDDPLTYVVTSLPTNGILKEGNSTILNADLPRVLSGNSLTYESITGGDVSFDFIVQQNSLATFAANNNLDFVVSSGKPVTFIKPEGKTYYLVQKTPNKMDWPSAKTLTDTFEGAQMFIPLDQNMDEAIYNAVIDMGILNPNITTTPFWYGLFQDKTAADWDNSKEPAGGWVWTDGVKLGSAQRPYVNWHPGEPNNGGNVEDHAQFGRFTNTVKWNDMLPGANDSYPLFEFSVNSADDSNTATVTITVEDSTPVANSQTLFFNEGSINNPITLTGSDPKSQPLTYIITSKPDKGTLKVGGVALGALPATVNPGDLTYTPENLDYYGDQKFNFNVNNGTDDSLSATVNIIIKNVNDAPESDPGNYTTEEELPIEITHIGRDKDVIDVFTVHTQMGTTLPQPAGVALGESMALSADGKRLILGAFNCPDCNNSFAQVYNWNGTDWDQLGATLDGDTTTDNFGEYVSISSDGNRIAVAGYSNGNANGADAGHVKVFDWDGTSWNLVGSPILGDKAGDKFGYRGLHLSGDGNSLAIPSFRGGYLHTYNWNETKWNKTGSITIVPNSTSEIPGQVYLSMDGNRLAVGSISDGTNGQVKIYDWNGTSWIQFTSIDGSAKLFGCTIDFSRDGKKLVVGEKASSLTRVYDLSGSSAVQIGSDIVFSGQQDAFFWRYVSISDDGNRVGIPVVEKKVGVFDWDGTSWNQLGEDLLATGLMGESFDMSSDGKIMAAGGHNGPNKVFNILNLEYIVTTLPLNGTLKEGAKTLVVTDLPYTLTSSDQKLTYTPDNNFSGVDSYKFKLNDGIDDSTDKLSGIREDSTVTITINDFVLALPNNYTITTTETCAGSDFGIMDIEVKEITYQKNVPNGRVIPLNYNVSITGPDNIKKVAGTITSPNKTLQLKDLPKGIHKLSFTVVGEPAYLEEINVTIIETVAPVAHPVADIEACDDNVDGEDANGKVNFVIDNPSIITKLLTDPNTGVVQDVNLFNFEYTYFDQATSALLTNATLPNPLYSENQTITVKMISKTNVSCEATQSINLVVNTLPVFERIDDTKFVCLNLDAVTIGVKSSDSRTYTYTWTRNGTAFNLNIPGFDSSILIGLGGDYEVTATTTDGTSCSQILKFNIGESDIATVLEKDIVIADLNPGPNNTITVLTATLGIGDYEFAIDDVSGPYQDEPTFENVRPGLHTIYIRDKNECGIVDIKSIIIGYKKFFTPNGDGINDTWNIIGLSKTSLPNSKIYIFDRFGKLLKELDPLGPGWDGTFIGKPMPSTDYWFRVVLEDGREFKSHFSLVRPW